MAPHQNPYAPQPDDNPDGPAGPPATPPTPSLGPEVGRDYEILRLIGHGAYGEVYLARDAGGAFCAVKVIFRESFDHDRPFEREYEGICKFERVSHAYANQVQVFHVGRRESPRQFYYIMELADDQTAGRAIDAVTYQPKTLKSELARLHRLPVKDCLRVGMVLARALENLHDHGLIHRDIKPANIIFVNGVPKLADIGLVTDRDVSVSYVGTEGYIPPEGPSTAQADIFSLGKVLYQMATGRDRLDYPELPTNLYELPDRSTLLELNVIIAKACNRDPSKRYQTANDLFQDLARLQRGQSIRRRTIGRAKLAVASAVGLAALAAGLFAWRTSRAPHSSPTPPSSPDLIAWWPADGNAMDHAGTNHGILVRGAAYEPGITGQAFALNGYSAYVQVPNSPQWSFGSNAFTLELWANFANPRGGQALMACDDGSGNHNKWIFWFNHGGVGLHMVRAGRGGLDFGYSSFAPSLNQWYHLAVTRQPTQYVFFINGTAVSTNADSHAIPALTAPLTIGAAEGGNFFNGLIDEARIHHRALDGTEIAAIYAARHKGMSREK